MISYTSLILINLFIINGPKCPEPLKLLADSDGLTWTPEDDKIVIAAQKGCKRRFGIDSCLISLTKRAERNYHAVCSSNNSNPAPSPSK